MNETSRKYLFLHRSEPMKQEGPPPSPEQMQAMFSAWNAWKEKFKGNIVDPGDKLNGTGKVVGPNGVSDGPFVEAKEIVGGYMIVSASSLDEAAQIAKEMPAMPGARIEVREMSGAKM
ncbi:MAG: YciI family protein [Polyangiaceae bacterium]